ncbi:MAG: hypothetical protein H8F28_11785 [Fibrella sp.]|nr:hypothetical protein [Armatimonadota bacterium]
MNLFNTLRELLWDNPMTLEATRTLRHSLRSGNNSENPYATQKLNRFLLGTLGFLYLWILLGIVRANESISFYLLMGELFLLTLVVPCSLYGAIALEREKQTYESLIMTRLTPAQIVCGKLWWRLGLILGIMALFMPLLIASHLNEPRHTTGITTPQLIWTQVVIFSWCVFIGAFSLWVSAKSKKGITALMGIIATLIAFLIMVPLLLSLFGGTGSVISPRDPLMHDFRADADYNQSFIDFYRRKLVLMLAFGLVYALNPFWMVMNLPRTVDYALHSNITTDEYWRMLGVNYWGIAVFAVLAVVFIRAAIKILRGLEMPVAEKVRRKSRMAFTLGKKGA